MSQSKPSSWKFEKSGFPVYSKDHSESFRVPDRPRISEWAERDFRMSSAYAVQGRLKLFPWQREPLDAIAIYDEVFLVGPVQTGKSLLAEVIAAWFMAFETLNMMFCYAKKETIADVFDERIKPLIKGIPCIRKFWDGDDSKLTKRRLKLSHITIRIASANVRSDLASYNAGFIYGSELAKWQNKNFDPVKMLFGRQQASRMLGRKVKAVFETSPIEEGDKSFTETHRSGVLFLTPHYPCPHCLEWIEYSDAQIKELPNAEGKYDHDANRIRLDKAARFECPKCKATITETERLAINDRVTWLAKGESYSEGIIRGRTRATRVVYNWNRLVDTSYSSAECLARYFEALHSPDPNALATYQNEDMARWIRVFSQRGQESWLKSKTQKYLQYGPDAYVPDAVTLLLCGVDTQDDGFYFIVRGFGKGMESWLVRCEFVACDMNIDMNANPAEVWATLNKEIHRWPYQKKSGRKVQMLFGLIDRGGHRSKDVDYIVSHSGFFGAYIGSASKGQLIDRKESGIFFGNTEQLSRIVKKQMETSLWHLPEDIQPAYLEQVLNQYDEEYTDPRGNKRKRWISGDTSGQPDHFRDCENYIVGASLILNLQEQLFDETVVAAYDHAQEQKPAVENSADANHGRGAPEIQSNYMGGTVRDFLKQGGW